MSIIRRPSLSMSLIFPTLWCVSPPQAYLGSATDRFTQTWSPIYDDEQQMRGMRKKESKIKNSKKIKIKIKSKLMKRGH